MVSPALFVGGSVMSGLIGALFITCLPWRELSYRNSMSAKGKGGRRFNLILFD